MDLEEEDVVTVYLQAIAGVGDWSGNGEVCVGYLKLFREE